MKRSLKTIWQGALVLAIVAVASPSASAQLKNFKTSAVVDQKADATAVFGQFTPTSSIDLSTHAVTLDVDGFSVTFAAGSFEKTWFGGFVASEKSGSTKAGILLQPLRGGHWFYSAAIEGFASKSASVTVSLSIGGQEGSAAGKAFVFP